MASVSLRSCLFLLLVTTPFAGAARSVPPRLPNQTASVKPGRVLRSVQHRLPNQTVSAKSGRHSASLRGPATPVAKNPHALASNRSHQVKTAKLLEMKKQAMNRTTFPVLRPHHITAAQPKLKPARVHLSVIAEPTHENMCHCEAKHQCTCKSTMRALHCVVDKCMDLSCDCNEGSFVDACERLAGKCGNLDMNCSKAKAVCESHTEHTGQPPERKRRRKGIPYWWKPKPKEAESKEESQNEESEKEEAPKADDNVSHGGNKSENDTHKKKPNVSTEEVEEEEAKAEKDEKTEKMEITENEEKLEKDGKEESEEEGKDESEDEEAVESENATATPQSIVVHEHLEFELNKKERAAIYEPKPDFEKVYDELYDLKERKCRLMFAMNDGWENLEDKLNTVLKKINLVLKALEDAGKKLPEMHCYKHFEEWHDGWSTTLEPSEAPKSSSLHAHLAPAVVTAALTITAAVTMMSSEQ